MVTYQSSQEHHLKSFISIRFISQNNGDVTTTFEGSEGSNFVNLIINYEVPSLFVSDTVNILV